MVVSMVQRADGNKRAVTIFEVPENGEKIHHVIQPTIKVVSTILTDDSKRYIILECLEYDHFWVNHGEKEYAHGPNNEIHNNTRENKNRLQRAWLRKHRGVNKMFLGLYCKTFQFIINHRHLSMDEQIVSLLLVMLNQTILYTPTQHSQ